MPRAAYLLLQISKLRALQSPLLKNFRKPLHRGFAKPLAWVVCEVSYWGLCKAPSTGASQSTFTYGLHKAPNTGALQSPMPGCFVKSLAWNGGMGGVRYPKNFHYELHEICRSSLNKIMFLTPHQHGDGGKVPQKNLLGIFDWNVQICIWKLSFCLGAFWNPHCMYKSTYGFHEAPLCVQSPTQYVQSP